ncbi:MAG TPA: lipopolysaccharide heptosyltransferase II [Planctomycetes bacterium]|nr:lipopolysaccharide heptosyltransferase II [Planctomycetota bacterium]
MITPPRAIVVRLPNWVGDVVMATPLLRALRSRCPSARIVAAARPHLLPIVDGLPYVDDQLPLPARAAERVSALRRGGFDVAVLLTHSLGSALDMWRARIPQRLGYRGDWRRLLLTATLKRPKSGGKYRPVPMVETYLDLLRLLDPEGEVPSDVRYELRSTPAEEAWLRAWSERNDLDLECDGPWVGINPGASFGASKLWDPVRFAEVADRLRDAFGWRPILLGAPGEAGLLRRVGAAMSGEVLDTSSDPIPLGPLKGLVSRLKLMVTTDSGPRAFAQAFDVPSVVLMGPTHPGWTAANTSCSRILRRDVPCGPCHLKVCPTDHVCMESITVEEVVAACREVVGV